MIDASTRRLVLTKTGECTVLAVRRRLTCVRLCGPRISTRKGHKSKCVAIGLTPVRQDAFGNSHLVRRDEVCWGKSFNDIQIVNGNNIIRLIARRTRPQVGIRMERVIAGL
jgi:hypothetical protein